MSLTRFDTIMSPTRPLSGTLWDNGTLLHITALETHFPNFHFLSLHSPHPPPFSARLKRIRRDGRRQICACSRDLPPSLSVSLCVWMGDWGCHGGGEAPTGPYTAGLGKIYVRGKFSRVNEKLQRNNQNCTFVLGCPQSNCPKCRTHFEQPLMPWNS